MFTSLLYFRCRNVALAISLRFEPNVLQCGDDVIGASMSIWANLKTPLILSRSMGQLDRVCCRPFSRTSMCYPWSPTGSSLTSSRLDYADDIDFPVPILCSINPYSPCYTTPPGTSNHDRLPGLDPRPLHPAFKLYLPPCPHIAEQEAPNVLHCSTG